ncbi:MAG TPA: CRISPR-associated helicase Cas3' [Bacilli bacterium]|jgi:CRISPR-associated endonuclease/helicase Cas3/CRISPR-associated endonuclease Cas3-HD|nr:CRISPR-associated helicase Cas3' [Bacilli bacterium]HPZ27641.1 CRISPR-associated helicase Cas3' [Bacilli bacterium]HQC90241.1 CRISPR-associated helicase Cas3' [Bacilli bacterium]
MRYYAHYNEKTYEYQTVEEHLRNVAQLAMEFANTFKGANFGYVSGMLHDVGKNSVEFQKRLLEDGKRVDHSTAGAQLAAEYFDKALGRLLAYIICGHHGGLMDFGSVEGGLRWRLEKKVNKFTFDDSLFSEDISELKQKLLNEIKGKAASGFSLGFFIRMVFSCLVDADFLDTESFMKKKDYRYLYSSFDELRKKFNDYMKTLENDAELTPVNEWRKQIAENCREAGFQKTNLFTLTVPTGGGKTLASMAFALNHLKHNNLSRIIYVIPYTSIIEQNAALYKKIFGEDNVLEHHSSFDVVKKVELETTIEKMKKAAENWNVPIVVTTIVQFFESLFSNKPSRCRKLHNIANSVVIIDEAQMLPINYLTPSLLAIEELVKHYHVSVILCTATKPEFTTLLTMKPIEIINNPDIYYELFKRVKIESCGDLSDDDLAELIINQKQVLTIVNTRRHCEELFLKIRDEENVFHLSAKMCPKHRSEVLHKIKNLLKENQKCRVVSTQLIECGVDISFPVVYRAMTGLDSIAQAAGRCNREGKLKKGIVYVFKSTEKHGKPVMFQNRAAVHGNEMLRKYFDDPLALDAIADYFASLYQTERENLDKKKIIDNFEEGHEFLGYKFKTTGMEFKIIENGENIIIPYDDSAKNIIKLLPYCDHPGAYLRKLQPYTISIHQHQLKNLLMRGYVKIISDRYYVLDISDKFDDYYNPQTGLIMDANEFLHV